MPLLQSSRLSSIAKLSLATTLLTLSAVAPAAPATPTAPSVPSAITPVAFAAPTATSTEPEAEVINITSGMKISEYNKLFTVDNCDQTVKEFPFQVPYKVDLEKMEFSTDSSQPVPKLTDIFNKQFTDPQGPKQILAVCECQLKAKTNPNKILQIPAPTDKTKTEEIEKYKKFRGIKDWISQNIIQNPTTCRMFQTKSPSSDSGEERRVNICAIQPDKLEVTELGITKTLLPDEFKGLDTDNNCQIDGNETCRLKLELAIQDCGLNSSQDSKLQGPIPNPDKPQETTSGDIACNRLAYYSCINGNLTYTNFDGGLMSNNLQTSQVLLQKDQKGLVGFFKTNDQGAGTDNPAINLVLYIINLLAGLSFMIAVAMLIIGGFYLVMASGNSEMTDKGKQSIKNFVLAITFTLLSYAIVTIIQAILYS